MDDHIIYSKRYDHEESELSAFFAGVPSEEPIFDNTTSADFPEEKNCIFIPALAAYFREARQLAIDFAETYRFDIDIIEHRIYNSIMLYFPCGISLSDKSLYDFVSLLKKCSRLKINPPKSTENIGSVELLFLLYDRA